MDTKKQLQLFYTLNVFHNAQQTVTKHKQRRNQHNMFVSYNQINKFLVKHIPLVVHRASIKAAMPFSSEVQQQ